MTAERSTASDSASLASRRPRLGLVTSSSVGWASVRARWEHDLADLDPVLAHIEDQYARLNAVTERYGAKSIGHSLAGRGAAADAIARGARVLVLSTLQNAPLVPLRRDVRYVVVGDATTSQLATLYGGTQTGLPGRLLGRRLRRLAQHGTIFACSSAWYRDALREEVGNIPDDQLVVLPFYVDVHRWTPDPDRTPGPRFQVLFIGADLERKGAHILYELARRPEFREIDFHVVSPHAVDQDDNVHAHTGMRGDSDELIHLVRRCDLFMLPTRADTSSIAATEAASCGLPSIITGVGGMREIILDGVTGTVIDRQDVDLFGEALATYVADPQLCITRGRAAREHIVQVLSREAHMSVLRATIARASASLGSG